VYLYIYVSESVYVSALVLFGKSAKNVYSLEKRNVTRSKPTKSQQTN